MPNQIFGRTDPTPFSRLDSESTSTQKDLETLLRLSSRSGDPHYRERNAYLNAAEDVQLDRIAGALWKQPLTDEVRAKACERLTDVLGREDMSLYMWMPQECEPRLRELWDMDTGRLFRIEIIEKLLDDYVNEDKYNSVEFLKRREERGEVPELRESTSQYLSTRIARKGIEPELHENYLDTLNHPGKVQNRVREDR